MPRSVRSKRPRRRPRRASLAVYTGADVAAAGLTPFPCLVLPRTGALKRRDGTDAFCPPHPIISEMRVRHVGDPVAMVVAETQAEALAAAERIDVAYTPLPAVTKTAEAAGPDAPQLWDEAPNNTCFHWEKGDRAATEAAFAARRADRLARPDQQSRGGLHHRAARRDRGLRRRRRALHTLCQLPAHLSCAQHHRRKSRYRRGGTAGDFAGDWRRLRHEILHLSGAPAGAVGGQGTRPARQVVQRADRGLSERHPGARSRSAMPS